MDFTGWLKAVLVFFCFGFKGVLVLWATTRMGTETESRIGLREIVHLEICTL